MSSPRVASRRSIAAPGGGRCRSAPASGTRCSYRCHLHLGRLPLRGGDMPALERCSAMHSRGPDLGEDSTARCAQFMLSPLDLLAGQHSNLPSGKSRGARDLHGGRGRSRSRAGASSSSPHRRGEGPFETAARLTGAAETLRGASSRRSRELAASSGTTPNSKPPSAPSDSRNCTCRGPSLDPSRPRSGGCSGGQRGVGSRSS